MRYRKPENTRFLRINLARLVVKNWTETTILLLVNRAGNSFKVRGSAVSKLKWLTKKSRLNRLARFVLAGLVNAIASFLIFYLLYSQLAIHYLLANLISFATWVWFGFEIQRRWVFQSGTSKHAFVKYILHHLVFLALASVLLWVQVKVISIDPVLAHPLTICVVAAGMYLVLSRFIFFNLNRKSRSF